MTSEEQQRQREALVRGVIRKCVDCAARDQAVAEHTSHERYDKHGIHPVVEYLGVG